MKYTLPLIAAAVLVAGPAGAADKTGWYVGADLGASFFDISNGDVDKVVKTIASNIGNGASGVTVTNYSRSITKTGFTGDAFVGYQLNPYVAFELAYMNLGDATAKYSGDYSYSTLGTDPTGSFHGNLKFESRRGAVGAADVSVHG